jgi:hypothetical protein
MKIIKFIAKHFIRKAILVLWLIPILIHMEEIASELILWGGICLSGYLVGKKGYRLAIPASPYKYTVRLRQIDRWKWDFALDKGRAALVPFERLDDAPFMTKQGAIFSAYRVRRTDVMKDKWDINPNAIQNIPMKGFAQPPHKQLTSGQTKSYIEMLESKALSEGYDEL